MDEIKTSWEQVSQRLSELGLKLKLHFEQAAAEGRPEEEDQIKESLRSAGRAIDQAFTALGAAAKDEAVGEDVRDVGRSLLDALDLTVSELGERFRSSIKRD
jgi:hypothetical protein